MSVTLMKKKETTELLHTSNYFNNKVSYSNTLSTPNFACNFNIKRI